MRNKFNEVTKFAEIVDIIKRCDAIRIAMHDGEYPYIVPMNFGEEVNGEQIIFYIHTGYGGKKNTLLEKNPNIAFEMDCNHELYYRKSNMSCNFRYESVVGTGKIEIVPEDEKDKALTLLMKHYHPETVKYNPKFMRITQCMKIVVNQISAKRAMPKKNIPDYEVMEFQGDINSPHMLSDIEEE